MDEQQTLAILRAISEPKRLEIVRRIAAKECESGVTCATILTEVDIAQSTLSHHIAELVQAGLVRAEPRGRVTLLSINRDALAEFQKNLPIFVLGE